MAHNGVSVANAGLWHIHLRMSAAKIRVCVTTTEVFQQVVLDPHILAVCIVSRCIIYADTPDYSASSYRSAGYRQWTM